MKRSVNHGSGNRAEKPPTITELDPLLERAVKGVRGKRASDRPCWRFKLPAAESRNFEAWVAAVREVYKLKQWQAVTVLVHVACLLYARRGLTRA